LAEQICRMGLPILCQVGLGPGNLTGAVHPVLEHYISVQECGTKI